MTNEKKNFDDGFILRKRKIWEKKNIFQVFKNDRFSRLIGFSACKDLFKSSGVKT